MNESRSKKALKTLKEMMIDRLYDVEEFKNKSDSILCKNEKNEFIFIKFITYNKIKPNIIKDLINTIYKNHLFDNLNNKLILIFNRKVNKSIYKLCDNKIYKNIEIKNVSRLLINITKHKFVPKHILINDNKELSILKNTYNLDDFSELPKLLKTDAISNYYNFKPGNIIKIIRPSQTTLVYVYYRYVI